MCRNRSGQFTQRTPCSLNAVDAQIHNGTPATKGFVESPYFWVSHGKSQAAFYGFYRPMYFLGAQAADFQVVRVVIQAVANAQLHLGGPTRGDHLFTFLNVEGHGFFTNDVFARLGCPNAELGVHGVGQNDIHDIDIRIVADFVEVVVVVNIFIRNLVLGFPTFGLAGSTRDDAREAAMLGLLEGWSQLPSGVVAEADQGYA